jgi:hypothetical protein
MEMAAGQWILVETLGRVDTWSVLSVGGTPKNWASLRRALPPSVLPIVAIAYESAEIVDRVLPPSRTRKSELPVRAVPRFGPDGRIHAVLVDGPRTEPPLVGTLLIDTDRKVAELDDIGYTVLGVRRTPGRTTWTVSEAFRRIEQFDDAMELVTKAIRSRSGDRWHGTLSAHTNRGLRTMRIALRNGHTDEDRRLWRGVFTDVTNAVPAPPSLEAVAAAAHDGGLTAFDLVSRPLPQLR